MNSRISRRDSHILSVFRIDSGSMIIGLWAEGSRGGASWRGEIGHRRQPPSDHWTISCFPLRPGRSRLALPRLDRLLGQTSTLRFAGDLLMLGANHHLLGNSRVHRAHPPAGPNCLVAPCGLAESRCANARCCVEVMRGDGHIVAVDAHRDRRPAGSCPPAECVHDSASDTRTAFPMFWISATVRVPSSRCRTPIFHKRSQCPAAAGSPCLPRSVNASGSSPAVS